MISVNVFGSRFLILIRKMSINIYKENCVLVSFLCIFLHCCKFTIIYEEDQNLLLQQFQIDAVVNHPLSFFLLCFFLKKKIEKKIYIC